MVSYDLCLVVAAYVYEKHCTILDTWPSWYKLILSEAPMAPIKA